MEFTNIGDQLVVRIDPKEKIIASLRKCCKENRLYAGFISSGVGMISNLELGFFDQKTDSYRNSTFPDVYDLTVFHGNISVMDEEIVIHAHIVMNDASFQAFGGHLVEGFCEVTLELLIQKLPSTEMGRRKYPGVPASRLYFPKGTSI